MRASPRFQRIAFDCSVVLFLFVKSLTIAPIALAQQNSTTVPRFEVVSVKAVPDESTQPPGIDMRGAATGKFGINNMSLSYIIGWTYSDVVRSEAHLIGGIPKLMSAHFSIEARFDPKVAEQYPKQDYLTLMLKALLADRFGLRVHIEERSLPVFVLSVARPNGQLGRHLQKSATKCPPDRSAAPPPIGVPRPCQITPRTGAIIGKGVSIGTLVVNLGLFPDLQGRPIVDETGLQGLFDFELEVNPGGQTSSIFAAIDEQLGLRLTDQSRRSSVLVVDSVEFPTPN